LIGEGAVSDQHFLRGLSDEPFGILRADHLYIESCFEQYESDIGEVKLPNLTGKILQIISMHVDLEEDVLYPVYLRIQMDAAHYRLCMAEHSAERRLAENIAFADPGDDGLELMMNALARRTRAHIRKEEGPDGVWALLRQSRIDLHRLGRCLQHHRDNHLARHYLHS